MTRRELPPADRRHLQALRRQTAAVLATAIGEAREVALLDVPNQRNAGDSLIWAGERAYLKSLGYRVRYTADLDSFDAARLRSAMPRGVVLMHGGGNFGDIWFGHQAHRERLARELREYRIVALPQTLFYHSVERARITNDVLSDHPDYTVLLRDRASLERAAKLMPDVRVVFCPDAAIGAPVPTAARARSATPSVVVIARADREASSELAGVDPSWLPDARVSIVDWSPAGWRRRVWAIARAVLRMETRLRPRMRGRRLARVADRVVAGALGAINRLNVAMARRRFCGARVIVADRLHAHILASLSGVDHVVLDNNYGKVRAVFDDYSGAFSTAHFAADREDACTIAMRLARR